MMLKVIKHVDYVDLVKTAAIMQHCILTGNTLCLLLNVEVLTPDSEQ